MPFMPLLTIIYGGSIFLVGVLGYFLTGGPGVSSPTALIPAALGATVAAFGRMAFAPEKRKLAMHIAVILAVVVAGAAIYRGGLIKLGELGSREGNARIALIALSLSALLSLAYIAMAVRSFINARRG